MNFKDLKEGDEIYIVNEGIGFGIRLETHKIESIIIKEEYNQEYFYLDDGTSFIVDLDFNKINSQGFIFSDKVKAQKYFLMKQPQVYSTLIGKAAGKLKQYNDLVEIMNNISEQKDEIEQDLILNGYTLES